MTPQELQALLKGEKKKARYSVAKKVKTADGQKFDSQGEYSRWRELVLLQMQGHISDLQRQVPIVLVPGVRYPGERARPAIRYVADFTYLESGATITEDYKGAQTEVFKIKRHLLKALHGIDLRLTGKQRRK